MARTEVINEWFFPLPALKQEGEVVPAPKEAVKKYQDLRDGWFNPHPKLPDEVPRLSLSPGRKQRREGYFVRTEIVYRW